MTIRYHTQHQARALASQIFVNDMPFNQVPGLQLIQQEETQAVITFENKLILTGNIARKILHGGIIASVLDVTAGLVCVSYALSRQETISVGELKQRLSRMGTIDLKVDYLRPGRGKFLPPRVSCYGEAIKSRSQGSNCIMSDRFISPAAVRLIWLGNRNY